MLNLHFISASGTECTAIECQGIACGEALSATLHLLQLFAGMQCKAVPCPRRSSSLERSASLLPLVLRSPLTS